MWRIRRSVRKKLIFGCVCVAVQVILFFMCQTLTMHFTATKYEIQLTERDTRIQEAERLVYITKCAVEAGEMFTTENTEQCYVLSEQNPETLATEVVGQVSCADLEVGMILNKALCCTPALAASERKCIFYNIGFAERFSAYDVVDVRIRYANGENYCVLKKKKLEKEEEEKKACGFFLTEEEQLLMSAAQYDVEVYEGAELYLVGFMEARLQEDAISEFMPSIQVMAQLSEWNDKYKSSYHTWCEEREKLEKRLTEHRKQRMDGLL